MNKRDLIPIMAEAAGITPEQAKEALDVMLESIMDAVRSKEPVRMRGFGSWNLRRAGGHGAVNPRTGERVELPDELKPYFKAAPRLMEFITGQPHETTAESGDPEGG